MHPPQKAVGPELDLGTRLLPSRLFSTASGRAQLSALINETLAFASPYVVAGTPWLYKSLAGAAGATSTTPAWRDAVWHLSIKWQFQYNDTLAARADGYRTLSAHIQKFRDLAPESGAYFVSGFLDDWMGADAMGGGMLRRTRAMYMNRTTRRRTGARRTTRSFSLSSGDSECSYELYFRSGGCVGSSSADMLALRAS